jgi:hypothetical protein
MFPALSTATPSALLVLAGFFSGSGMNARILPVGPSLMLPTRMPRVHAVRSGAYWPYS